MTKSETVIRILATSDLHGKMVPWSYAVDQEDTHGSMAQLSEALRAYRTEQTVYIDAGDLIQDNSAELFLNDPVHPMVQALNRCGCDIWVTGNHEYNFGIDAVRKTIADLDALTLTGNVYLPDGSPLAPGYTIIERGGIRIAVIGMVSHNIKRWDEQMLSDCDVTDMLEETRKVIDSLQGGYDVLIGVYHAGISNECSVPNTGVTDICNACPEFDLVISSHEHIRIPEMRINNVLVVQNAAYAATMSVIDLSFERKDDAWKLCGRKAGSVDVGDYPCDPEILELLRPYHERARKDAAIVIGELRKGPLAEMPEVNGVPRTLLEDTALIDLINRVQMHYSQADISATPLCSHLDAFFPEGPIRKCDTSRMYRFPNMLYKVLMTGKQLRKHMEYCARFYNTFRPGDLTVSFNPEFKRFHYNIYSGVNYEINISKEPGERIEHLTWPDGTPVKDTDRIHAAVNYYCANSALLHYGDVFQEGEELPVLEEADIRSDLGGVRELIGDYIRNVKQGILTPQKNGNWKLTGISWNPSAHETAVRLLNNGSLTLPCAECGSINSRSIRGEDLPVDSDNNDRRFSDENS